MLLSHTSNGPNLVNKVRMQMCPCPGLKGEKVLARIWRVACAVLCNRPEIVWVTGAGKNDQRASRQVDSVEHLPLGWTGTCSSLLESFEQDDNAEMMIVDEDSQIWDPTHRRIIVNI